MMAHINHVPYSSKESRLSEGSLTIGIKILGKSHPLWFSIFGPQRGAGQHKLPCWPWRKSSLLTPDADISCRKLQ